MLRLERDLLLLQKINRNLQTLQDATAVLMAEMVKANILRFYGCHSSKECEDKIIGILTETD